MFSIFSRKKEKVHEAQVVNGRVVEPNLAMEELDNMLVEIIDEKEVKQKTLKEMSMQEIVDEIHDTFYTEVDRLLDSAKNENSLKSKYPELLTKSKRLKALGFISAESVVKSQEEEERIKTLAKENEAKKDLIQAINYFSQKYPMYKFITENSVKKICEKYGLVYGSIEKYIGKVPDKNITDIENFSISKEDKAYNLLIESNDSSWGWQENKLITYSKFIKAKPSERYIHRYTQMPFEIAGPKDDFNMQGMRVVNNKIEEVPILDPVVLQPVYFNNTKHYLIVTAWGPESYDPLVMNENLN